MQDLFFYVSKVFWALASPDHLLLLLILIGLLLVWAGKRFGLWLSLVSVMLLLIVAVFPVGNLLLKPLEQRVPQAELPKQVAGIIILGGAEEAALSAMYKQPHMNSAAERVMTLPMVAEIYLDVPVVITGGSSSVLYQQYRGADVVAQWADQIGLRDRLIVERQARNTFENAVYTGELVDKNSGQWLLVTSAFHMPRSVGIFRKQGWDVVPYAVDYRASGNNFAIQFWRNMRDLSTAVREWIGLLAYYLTGKTDQLLPEVEANPQ
ncbi:YdcF family protein [Pontibacterium sp.]|uniref:YdcF family protein n=1 Tax=Pontibacterium sp. TaxID=2036026 RepID=UPI003518152C